jgi:hypothetical protein
VFIIEANELELAQQIGQALKVVEEKSGVTASDAVVELDRENEEESYRKRE